MSKKVVFTGNFYGSYQPFEPGLYQLDLQERKKLSPEEEPSFDDLSKEEWLELCLEKPSLLRHPASFPLDDELRKALLVMAHFRKKNYRIGSRCAAALSQMDAPFCEITAFDMTNALPRRDLKVSQGEIQDVLAPFLREQRALFAFLSSGETRGILPAFLEEKAKEFTLHSRVELENLIALCRPESMIYLKEYRSDLPCRLPGTEEITKETCGLLLYKEQQEEALQLLTGCTPEEAVLLRQKNAGAGKSEKNRKKLLRRIAAWKNIPEESAAELFRSWHYYTASSMERKEAREKAFRICLQTLERIGV